MPRINHLATFVIVLAPGLLAGCRGELQNMEIQTVLDKQVADWNRGDIPAFMEGYWKSDELRFESMSPRGLVSVTRGWQATLERYQKRYDTPEKIGHLRFTQVEILPAGPNRADVTGRYELVRGDGRQTGRFSLDMRRINYLWVIVRDRTTADPVTPPSTARSDSH